MRRLILTTALMLVVLAPETAQAAWLWPVAGDVITPYRNGSDPYATGQHRGIDIAAPAGTAVVAAAGGEVRFAGTVGSSGVTVSVRTSDGYDTSYLHLSSLTVRAGARVSAGDRIGAVGTTGTRSAAAPHLHFGVRDAGTRHAYHDPLTFLPPPPSRAPSPRPAPPVGAPAPTPAPPVPAPAPGPARAPRGEPARRGLPRPLPPPHRAPRPVGAPRRAPRPITAPHRAPRPVAAPPPTGEPARALTRGPRAVRGARPHSVPVPGRPRPPLGVPRAQHRLRPEPRATPSPASPGSGLDIGWALACGGLLLAAAVLGLASDRPGTRATGRTRVAVALRALGQRR